MRRHLLIIGAVVASLLLGAGVAAASVPGPDGTIHGCYQTAGLGDGALYVIDSEDECPTGFTGLDWDQTSPSGVAGYEVVTASSTATTPQSQHHSTSVDCPTGKVALGGGGSGERLETTRPVVVEGVATGWFAQVGKLDNVGGTLLTATVWAICATEETP